jgi:ABC-type methionine transport system permease subunit
MDSRDKTPNFFVREIPFIVLLVFWVIYAGIEIIRSRLDILTSIIPTGIFILAYVVVRLTAKEQKGRG